MPPCKPLTYSASKIKTFSTCAFRHYYKTVVPTIVKKTIEGDKTNEKKRIALPSHSGIIFHNVVDIVHKQYIGAFPTPSWEDVERFLDCEFPRYQEAHIKNCIKENTKITVRDEHKTVIFKLLRNYYEVFWTSPVEKVVASELKCRSSDIKNLRQMARLPRGDRYTEQTFYERYGVAFDDVIVSLTGSIDYIYKSPDHRRVGICDFKTVFSSNRKEVERQFASQVESTRFQLGVYATIVPHWLDPEVMLEGVLSEASVRLISPLGFQQRTFNKDEVQKAKDDVRRKIAALIQLRKKHVPNPEKWVQSKNFACAGCEAFNVCKTANPEAKKLIPDPEWEVRNQKQLSNATIEKPNFFQPTLF